MSSGHPRRMAILDIQIGNGRLEPIFDLGPRNLKLAAIFTTHGSDDR